MGVCGAKTLPLTRSLVWPSMRAATSLRLLLAMLLVALGALGAGCGKTTPPGSSRFGQVATPGARGEFSVATTKNTTRLGGADPATDAAAVALAVYPGLTPATRPRAVVLVDEHSWPAALAASALASAPLGAPLLYSEGDTLPAATSQALEAMHPVGAQALGSVQVIRVGTTATVPDGYRTRGLTAGADEPAAVAATVERLVSVTHGFAPRQVIVTAAEGPTALEMPAAGLAAESGAPILFVTAAGVPAATAAVLSHLHRPAIYVVAPSAVSSRALAALARFGPVTPVSGGSTPGEASSPAERYSPVDNAIAVSRFAAGSFGWGIHEGGHGLVFANAGRPLDAPAAAPLSATGDYAPLLLLGGSSSIPLALAHYLSDIQPGYSAAVPPIRGYYNHGWLIGDESAISAVIQAELDSALEISPSKASGKAPLEEEPTATPAE
jgi:hypothetical protein